MSKQHPSTHRLGPADLVPPGEGRNFKVGAVHLAVFHARGGGYYATQAGCPHKNGPLADGLMGGTVVVCPLHARKFDVATGARVDAQGPSEAGSVTRGEGLRTFPLEVVDGELVVEICAQDCDAA
jgi:nitrite reductase (NADH) small subunit